MQQDKAKWFQYFSYAAGLITMSPILQFFLPQQGLALSHIQLQEPAAILFAQHWGMMAFCMGLLLIWAARQPIQRKPVLALVALEKLALVALITFNWQTQSLQGMHLAGIFDAICVAVLAVFLLKNR